MVNIKYSAAHALNSYVWNLLKNNTSLTEADYGNRVPIIPSGQEPEFEQYPKPFLVYGFAEDSTPDLYADRSGSLSYAVFSTSGGEIGWIMNIIKTAMERRDESARAVNNFTSTPEQWANFAGFRFGDIYVSYFEGPSPEETEGGRKSGIITLRYKYYAEYEVKTFQPDGSWV